MYCPTCGSESQDGASFCQNCGGDLRQIAGRENRFYPVSGDIGKSEKQRRFTDNIISRYWILVPIICVSITYGAMFYTIDTVFFRITQLATPGSGVLPTSLFPNLDLLYVIVLVPDFFFLYLFYMLVKRRNQHFERQRRLFYNLTMGMRQASILRGDSRPEANFNYIENMRYYQYFEEEKSASLFAVLLIIPVVNFFAFLYILNFLTQDFRKHEQIEDRILTAFSSSLSILSVQVEFRREHPVPERSSLLYIILTLITLGIFSLYWDYVLIKDPNGHFEDQKRFEDILVPDILSLSPISTQVG